MPEQLKRSNQVSSVIDMEPGELKNFPDLRMDYERWKEDPITKMVFNMLKNMMRPNANGSDFVMALASDAGLVGTSLYMRQCGAQWMIDTALSLTDEEKPVEELEANFSNDNEQE